MQRPTYAQHLSAINRQVRLAERHAEAMQFDIWEQRSQKDCANIYLPEKRPVVQPALKAVSSAVSEVLYQQRVQEILQVHSLLNRGVILDLMG